MLCLCLQPSDFQIRLEFGHKILISLVNETMLSGTTFAQSQVAVKNCDEFYKNDIPLDDELTAQAVQVVEQFVKKAFMSKMKECNGLFNVLYSRIYHGGSYYDGLSITEPT